MNRDIIDNSKLNNPKNLNKEKYLVQEEQDRFTKITEHRTSYICFKSDLVDNYIKSLSDFYFVHSQEN